MIIFFFGSLIIGAILVFLASKIQTKSVKWVVRIAGLAFIFGPLLYGLWGVLAP